MMATSVVAPKLACRFYNRFAVPSISSLSDSSHILKQKNAKKPSVYSHPGGIVPSVASHGSWKINTGNTNHHYAYRSTSSISNFSTVVPDFVDNDNERDTDISSTASIPDTVEPLSSSTTKSSSNKFSELSNLHPSIKAALKAMNIENMTEIQQKTFQASVSGNHDVLGRSRTGSGKTLAFLVPSLERILRNHSNSPDESKNKVKMLIISPTRELAHQIYTTTMLLTDKLGMSSGSKRMHCQVMYGGTQKKLDIHKMQKNVPSIITSTPGRLLDHLKTTKVHGATPFTEYIKDIDVLVLDEMDLLLDMGFREDIQSIFQYFESSKRAATVPPRQTLLFSATLPAGVKDVLRKYVRPKYVVVDCIQDDDPSSHTVSTIEQSHVILPPNKMIAGVVQTILALMNSNKQHKIIVFFPTTSQVTYFSNVFKSALGRNVIEIHSGISQVVRTNRSDTFRHSKTGCVLFTSDVSARGVDYPDVTHVVQVGTAMSRETYIHRLGRTGRAGKSGQGLIILLPYEVPFLQEDLGDIKIPMNVRIQDLLKREIGDCDDLEDEMMRIHDMTERSEQMKKSAQDVYRSIFGYYGQRFKAMRVRNSGDAIVSLVNGFAKQAGLQEIPALSPKLAAQYGLTQHPELNIQHQWDTGSRNFDVGRGGGGGGGRGGNNRFGGNSRSDGGGGGRGGNNRFGGNSRSDGGFRSGAGRGKNIYSKGENSRGSGNVSAPLPPEMKAEWTSYLR